MNSQFVTNKPEKLVKVIIWAKEVHLLKILRKYQFGKIVIHKANGVLVRVEPTDSILINEEEGEDLK